MKHSYTFATAVMLMAAVFAGVVIISDNSVDADAGYTISVDATADGISNKTLGNSLVIEDGAISGSVKLINGDNVEKIKGVYGDSDAKYYYIFSIVTGSKDKYVSFINTAGNLVSAQTTDGAGQLDILAALPASYIKDGVAAFTFEYVVTAQKLENVTSFEGYQVYSIPFDLTCDDKITNAISWVADGVTIASYEIPTTSPVIPSAPVKANYDFLGWAVDGKTVITYNSGLVNKDQGYTVLSGAKTVKDYVLGLTDDTVFTAVFQPVSISVTTVVGDAANTITMAYGEKFVQAAPAGYQGWTLDLETEPVVLIDVPYTVTENVTFYAVPEDVVVAIETPVYFVVDGEVIATYKAGEVTLPTTPVKEGYIFVGWAVGQTIIEDPVAYAQSESVTFVAVFTPVDVPIYEVTFVDKDGKESIVRVAEGMTVEAPVASEGYFWNFNFDDAITEDVAIYEVPLKVVVTFMVGTQSVSALRQVLDYGAKYDMSALEGYVLPAPYVGWDVDLESAVFTKDTVVHAVEPAPTTPFYKTTVGEITVFVIVLLVIFGLYAVYTDMFGIKTKLFGLRKKDKTKTEAPASDATGVQEKQE